MSRTCRLLVIGLIAATWACDRGQHAQAVPVHGGQPLRKGDAARARSAGVSVLQHHDHASRDGVYVDARLTHSAVKTLHIDPRFAEAAIDGPTYAQPLYFAGEAGRPDLIIAATEHNHVYAFDAESGERVWDRVLGVPVPRWRLPCGNIDPLGVTGTPVIDPKTRTLYVDAMSLQGLGVAHRVFALDADSGEPRAGWPVDLNSTVRAGTTRFESRVQNQRGALILLGGNVFVPFGGHYGDCGSYHGWVVGISLADPTRVHAWVTRAIAGGVWAPGGIASDGRSLFFATGNTERAPNRFSAPDRWQDGDAILRLPPSLKFSGQPADYFAPSNWKELDDTDRDLGGSNPVLFDAPGLSPSKLVIALGKDGHAYVLDQSNLGGIGSSRATAAVSVEPIINAPAAYTTPEGTYVVFKGRGKGCPSGQTGGLTAIELSDALHVGVAFCAGPETQASPSVSMSDAKGRDAIIWIVGRDDRLHGLDADTGRTLVTAEGEMSSVQKFQAPIVAGGRIFVAADDRVYAFTP